MVVTFLKGKGSQLGRYDSMKVSFYRMPPAPRGHTTPMNKPAQNVGPLDRATRIILGIILIAVRYLANLKGIAGDVLVFIGALWIWEGLLGYCLGYGLLGWSTKRREN